MTENNISKATVSRLPAYLRYLKGERARGVKYVSSAVIAKGMGLSAVGVRKDLAVVSSVPGKPRFGFEVDALISDVEKFLGYDVKDEAIVIGAGGLGKAILSYEGFENYGIEIVAAFDSDTAKIGTYGGKPVYPMNRIGEIVRRNHVEAAILTVPRAAAQSVCDLIVEAGIKSVLNFAPVYLVVPDGVTVKYVDLAASFAECMGIPRVK